MQPVLLSDRDSHYFNTFGSNPVACATTLAVLEVIEKENLQANALKTGDHVIDIL